MDFLEPMAKADVGPDGSPASGQKEGARAQPGSWVRHGPALRPAKGSCVVQGLACPALHVLVRAQVSDLDAGVNT